MYSKLFHKDVYFPKGLKETATTFQSNFMGYTLSKHLQEHLAKESKDRSHNYLEKALLECLATLKDNPQEPFEIEVSKDYHFFGKSGWYLTKYCVRIPYNDNQDIVVAIRPYYNKDTKCYDDSRNKIVTAWMNSKEDAHFTLNSNNYCGEQEWKYVNENC